MNKRDQIQKDALTVAINNKRCGLGISMGVGKTLIGLKYIDHLQGVNTKKVRVLVVAPKLSIFQSWKDDAEKFSIDISDVEFTTYLSLNKNNPQDYDVVILDECHSLLYSHRVFLLMFTGRILGLTGTPPRDKSSDRGLIIKNYCPIKYEYIMNDAVNDNILNDYKIIVHYLELDTKATIPVKNNSFKTSEKSNYAYWTKRLDEATTQKSKQIAAVMRMKAMMEYYSKEDYAYKLFNQMEDKCILFCNTQEQADRLCKKSYHSNNPNSEDNLIDFKNGVINKLSCVLQLNEGVNIPKLKSGIIMHAYGNERKSAQRIGRCLRLSPNETAVIHILCYMGTVDETWVKGALEGFSDEKIIWKNFNIKLD